MIRSSWAARALISLLAISTSISIASTALAQPNATQATCAQGFVWRQACSGDYACVPPQSRDQAAADDRANPGRQSRNGNCAAPYVWRQACSASDHVCVLSQVRAQAQQENALAASRTASGSAPAPRQSVPGANPAYQRQPSQPVIHQPPPAQSGAKAPTGPFEVATIAHFTHLPPSAPISYSWHFKQLNGTMTLTVNPDGSYRFGGNFADRFPGEDWDATVGLKNSAGGIYLFHYEGSASNGIHFAKEGKSAQLKEDFASFASDHQATWTYTFHREEAGRLAQYAAMEQRRIQLQNQEAAALQGRNQAAVNQVRQQQADNARAQLQFEQNYESSHPEERSGSRYGLVNEIASIPGQLTSQAVNTAAGVTRSVISTVGSVLQTLSNPISTLTNPIGTVESVGSSIIKGVGGVLKSIF